MVEKGIEYRAARRAYEYGRLRTSAWWAAAISTPIAVAGWLVSGWSSLVWLPVTLLVWIVAYWRGGTLLRGAFYGLFGGVVTFALPMSILRPCCAPGAMVNGADCCTMPGACLAAGGVVGVVLAAFVPFGRDSWWRTATGMVSAWRPSRSSSALPCSPERPSGSLGASPQGSSRRAPRGRWCSAARRRDRPGAGVDARATSVRREAGGRVSSVHAARARPSLTSWRVARRAMTPTKSRRPHLRLALVPGPVVLVAGSAIAAPPEVRMLPAFWIPLGGGEPPCQAGRLFWRAPAERDRRRRQHLGLGEHGADGYGSTFRWRRRS